jgi:hypothetical protein
LPIKILAVIAILCQTTFWQWRVLLCQSKFWQLSFHFVNQNPASSMLQGIMGGGAAVNQISIRK